MENTIKQNLIESFRTNNYIGQLVHKKQLVEFLVKNSKSTAKNKYPFFVA